LDSVTQKLVVTQGKFFSAFDFLLCNPTQQPLYTLTLTNQSLCCTIAGVLSLFHSFCLLSLPSVPYSMPSFLNETVLNTPFFTKPVYNQTSNCSLSDNAQHTLW
jgi:hypothetical protein